MKNDVCARQRRALFLPFLVLSAGLSGCLHTEYYDAGKRRIKKEGSLTLMGLQTGRWVFYYPDGTVRAEGSYDDDAPDGDWTYWYRNANVETEGEFDDQRRDGEWRYYYASGKPRARGRFERGRRTGFWTYWREDGTKEREGYFLDEKPTLLWNEWDEEGALSSSGYLLDGQKVGAWRERDPGGENVRTYPLPEGVELVEEEWEPGKLRRTGFVRDGEKEGLWVTFHRSGAPRLVACFADGRPEGVATAWAADGEPVAAGPLRAGQLAPGWRIWSGGEELSMALDDFSDGMFGGLASWSEDTVTEERGADQCVHMWLVDIDGDVEPSRLRERSGPSVAAAETEVVEVPPPAPAPVVGATVSEKENQEFAVKAFETGSDGSVLRERRSRGGRYQGQRGGRDDARSDAILERGRLPVTRFLMPDGEEIDLASDAFRGKRVVFVVLRGYSGSVCLYCCAQVKALGRFVSEFEKRDARLCVVYPGVKDGFSAFRRLYEVEFGEEVPRFSFLFDADLELVTALDIMGREAYPTTMIIDASGKIRFAYVGLDKASRPSAMTILEQLDAFEPGRLAARAGTPAFKTARERPSATR